MKNLKFLFLTLLATTLVISCSDDDDTPPPINEEEVITTLILTMTPQGGGADIVFSTTDADGDGPGNPVILDGFTLDANTSYDVTVEVLDESDPTDVEDITEEVEEEDDEHQFFYVLSAGSNITFTYNDQDDNGNPIGLNTTFNIGDPETGTLTVTLLHEPIKDAAGVSDGDPTNAGGETDITTTFDFVVQ